MRLAKSLFVRVLAATMTTIAVGAFFVALPVGATTESYSYHRLDDGAEAQFL
jgi:hypothetical protein